MEALLAKLEPEAMMQPNGTRAAEIAVGLLEKKAAEGGMASQLQAPVQHPPSPDCGCVVLPHS